MNQTESVRCKTIHEDLGIGPGRMFEEEAELIHEHYLVAARPRGLNYFVICCLTCGDCYCNICGKLLKRVK